MMRNQVRDHVSDSVEYGFDKLHRAADRYMVYPLAVVEGAIQGVARGVQNMVTHKHHHLDQATTDPGKCKCKCKRKPPGSAYGQPVGPYLCYGCPPPPPPTPTPPPSLPSPTPPPPAQFQYHPAFPVPCRPPY